MLISSKQGNASKEPGSAAVYCDIQIFVTLHKVVFPDHITCNVGPHL